MRSYLTKIVLVLAVVVTACGGDDSVEEAAPDDPAADEETEPAEETGDEDDAPAAGDIDPDGVLVYADFTGNDTLDPDREQAGSSLRPLFPVYDRLIHTTPDGELVPGLATEWDFVDDTTFELSLREGVVFHDGAIFEADVVVANLERSMTLEEASSNVQGQAGFLDSVEAVDETTVRINLNEPNFALPFSFASNIGMMISPDALDNEDLDLNPVGAGMFTVTSFSPSDRTVYEPFGDYWDPDSVLLGGLEIVTMSDAETRLNAVRSGQVQLTTVEGSQVQDAEAAGLEVDLVDTIQIFTWFQNVDSDSPLASLEFRQAIQHAIDRQSIVEAIAFGAGSPVVQMLPPGSPSYNEDYGPDFYNFDPVRAQELLEEAGYDGAEVTALILNRPEDVRMAEVIQALLSDVGISLELQVVEPVRVDLFTDEACCDFFLGSWRGRDDPFETLQSNLPANSRTRPGDVSIDGVDEQLSVIAGTELGAERDLLIQQLSGLAVEQAIQAPLYSRQIPYVDNGCVTGFQPYPNAVDEYRGVGILAGC